LDCGNYYGCYWRFNKTTWLNFKRIMLENLKDKKILILGFGKEGIDTYLALRKLFPEKVFGIADKKDIRNYELEIKKLLTKDKNLKLYLGENYLNAVGEYDLIIKTPGISQTALGALGTKKPSAITSQTEIFFENFPGIVVGVTGTKGKGTTSSLIYEILKKAGLKVFLGGNIGKPVFQYLLKALPPHQSAKKDIQQNKKSKLKNIHFDWCGGEPQDIFVYELSSHQLQNLKKSPQIAVFLNILQDHLDYYKNSQEYEKAKANIALHQTENDYLIFNSLDEKVKQIATKSNAIKIPFSSNTQLTPFERSLKMCYGLKGDHNFLNLRAALKVAELFKVKPDIIKMAVKNFKGLPHRLEYIGKFQGIEFYDNSMATIPQSTILDLQTFNGKEISLIVGGSDKGSDYNELAKEIIKNSVKNLIILGQGTGQKILKEFEGGVKLLPGRREELNSFQTGSMKEAAKICYEQTPKNGVCLLSPASASFNLFIDYKDRGKQFKKYVKWYDNQK